MKKFLILFTLILTLTASLNAREVTLEAKITGLYVAYFNRAGDQEGLTYWTNRGNSAQSRGESISDVLKQLSAGFATHPVFTSTYGHLDDRAFVEAIYRNALGRDGDSEGINYWTGELEGRYGKRMSRSDMVSIFVEAALVSDLTHENYPNLSGAELAIAQLRQDLITNKVTVALAFTHQLGMLSNMNPGQYPDPEDDPAYKASIKIISEVNEEEDIATMVVAFLHELSYYEFYNISDPIGMVLSYLGEAEDACIQDTTYTSGDTYTYCIVGLPEVMCVEWSGSSDDREWISFAAEGKCMELGYPLDSKSKTSAGFTYYYTSGLFADLANSLKISIIAENLNVPITDPLTQLRYEITSKYAITSFQVKINNVDKTELATLTDKLLVIQPTSASSLPFDYLITTLTLTDEKGRTHTESFSYIVDLNVSISSGFTAEPQIGYAPLEVTFSPKVSADESIQLYHWDFGDGTKDESNTSRQNLIGTPVKHTYNEAGEYQAVLTIYDSLNQPATSQLLVKIYNKPPVVTGANVSPSNGSLPLRASFSATATDNEGIREFLWDFDGDGEVDFNDSKNPDYVYKYTSSSHTYTYGTEGRYQASLRVVDINGAITEVSTPALSVLVGPNGTPTARTYTASGETPLSVGFSSGYGSFSKWEWDFDGDGIFDYSSTTSGTVDHNYTAAGTYFAKLQVTNSDGLKSSDSIEITIDQDISLARNTDTIEIKNGQSVGLDVTVVGETDTKLVVESSRYQPVKTLFDWGKRSGTFSIAWDGTDADGSIVPEGAYYIVLLYKEAGVTKRFDLRAERDNVYTPISTNISAGDVFAPYLAPMLITFELIEASEVSLDIGPDGYSVTERIKTLLLKQPLGKGIHTIAWAGDANDGTLADLSLYKEKYPYDADYYMTGGFKSKLADNAVFVKSGVSVLNLKSDAPVYVPNAIGEDEKRKSLAISFDLTAAASVTLTVNDAKSGATVVTRHTAPMAKGSQVILWDGKDADGKYIAPGVYRIGVKATDSYGHTSLTQYALQRIFY